jgi:hypothetical protein
MIQKLVAKKFIVFLFVIKDIFSIEGSEWYLFLYLLEQGESLYLVLFTRLAGTGNNTTV